jgi:DNA-3-methyladenine glycosylase
LKLDNYLTSILAQPAIEAAPQLLGCILQRKINGQTISLKIVETEAYHQDDPASHTYRGLTKRTAPMFEAGGRLYIYFTYGMHYCVNIVTGSKGTGEAVLIRAAEPVSGIATMKALRDQNDLRKLANGPGKLAQALGITDTKLSGERLSPYTINLLKTAAQIEQSSIISRPRIGISRAKDLPYRFYISGNEFVSKL